DALPAATMMMEVIKTVDKILAKRVANWLATDVQAVVTAQEKDREDLQLDASALIKLAQISAQNEISSTGAKAVLETLVVDGGDPLTIAKERDLLQVSDEGEIEGIVKGVLSENPKAAEDVRNGEMKAIGFLVGQVMKESK